MLCGVCISPHSTFVCNTAAKTLLPEYGQKGYNSRVVRNFRCVGGVFTRIGPQVFAALGARRIIFCTSWLSFYPFRAKLTSPFFTFYARPPFCFHSGARWGPSFVVQKGRHSGQEAGRPATGPPWALADRSSRAGNKVGPAPCNSPPPGCPILRSWPPWELRRFHALRGVGRGTWGREYQEHPERAGPVPRAGKGIKRQGTKLLSRSPVH